MSSWSMPRFKDGVRVVQCVGFWQIDVILADMTGCTLTSDEIRAQA